MRSIAVAAGILLLGLVGWGTDTIPPTSTATLDPAPNAYGWNRTPVTVAIVAVDDGGSGVAEIHYVLDGGDVETVSGDTAIVRIETEGIHTLEFWAVDGADNEETHHVLQIKIDLTPPAVFVESPEEGKEYLLHEPVEASWFAFDNLSGIDDTEATTLFGEEILTEDVGFQVFMVRARDKAGNETVVEVNYHVVYKVVPAGAQGTYIDRPLPPEERKAVGRLPLLGRYVQGQLVEISFYLKDYYDEIYPDGVPALTVTEVRFEDSRERHTIWDWLAIPFDEEKGVYRILYPTAARRPGIYDLWIGFGDGNHVRLRIEILPRESGG